MNDPISVFLSYYTLNDLFTLACHDDMSMMDHQSTRKNILVKLLCDIQKDTGAAELTTEQLTSISQIMASMED